MEMFDHSFTVEAPIHDVREFHRNTSALKKLTPPPMIVQMHAVEPLAEGSVSEFTLWLGPLPIRWRAVHRDVSDDGFTDVQERGPAKSWRHTHTFVLLDERTTRVDDHVEYEFGTGWNAILTRLLFCKPGLRALFSFRKLATRRGVRTPPGFDGTMDGGNRVN